MIISFYKFAIFMMMGMTLSLTSSSSREINLSDKYLNGEKYMRMRLHGTLELPEKMGTSHIFGLSDLAWDEDEQLLYAISDRGHLFHFKPQFVDHTLVNVELVQMYRLKEQTGKQMKYADSEGLAIINGHNQITGDTELLISFEKKPRIIRFTAQGAWLADITLPDILQNKEHYIHSNRMLESVTIHPTLGILTAPEFPLKADNGSYRVDGAHKHAIYATDGKSWKFPAYPASQSGIVSLEALADSSVLVLERSYISPLDPLIISLRKIWLSTCDCTEGFDSQSEQIVVLDNSKDWAVDNFEGLTHHQGNYFFIVSDNNDNKLQRTLLTYFEIL